jgi:hypothetical protein
MRDLLVLAKALAILALAAIAFVFWAGAPHSPDLQPEIAASLIAACPEFIGHAALVQVLRTTRGTDSMNTCCYTAEFAFRQNGSRSTIFGRADFRLHGKNWHMTSFRWGEPPMVNTVWVASDSSSAIP